MRSRRWRRGQTIANYWLLRHLVAFRRAYPQIQIRFAIANTMQVAAAIESGLAELGFVEDAVENEHLASAPWRGTSSWWSSHRGTLGRPQPADGRRPQEWGLGHARAGSGQPIGLRAGAGEIGIDQAGLRIQLELPSNESVRAAVEAGLGAAALSARGRRAQHRGRSAATSGVSSSGAPVPRAAP